MARRITSILLGVPERHSLDVLYPPVGLLYLAAAVRQRGHRVRVVDAQIEGEDALLEELVSGGYEWFGTTVLTPLRMESFRLIKAVKQLRPECKVVTGGAHVSILPQQTLSHVREIDFVVPGEGEATLVELLEADEPSTVQGLWWRENGTAVFTGNRDLMDPCEIPQPAWDLIDITPYRACEAVTVKGVSLADKPFLTIYSSRGCKGSCSFCSTWWIWKQWRRLPVVQVVEELAYLNRQGIEHFFFADDSMITDEASILDFAAEMKRVGLRIHYKIACRADVLTPGVAEALRESGCYEVHVGFESGSQRILNDVGKGLTVADNIRAAELIRENGMRVYALMLIGSIGEDIASINETIVFLRRINPEVIATMGGLMLLPGTRDYQRAKREGLVDDDFWLGEEPFPIYTGGFSPEELVLLVHFVRQKRLVWGKKLMFLQTALVAPRLFWNFLLVPRLVTIFKESFRWVTLTLRGGRVSTHQEAK